VPAGAGIREHRAHMFGQFCRFAEPAWGAFEPAAGVLVESDVEFDVDEDELGVVDVELSAA
jgi:hypothetical protein